MKNPKIFCLINFSSPYIYVYFYPMSLTHMLKKNNICEWKQYLSQIQCLFLRDIFEGLGTLVHLNKVMFKHVFFFSHSRGAWYQCLVSKPNQQPKGIFSGNILFQLQFVISQLSNSFQSFYCETAIKVLLLFFTMVAHSQRKLSYLF